MAPDPAAVPAPPPSDTKPANSPLLVDLPQAVADPSPALAQNPFDPPRAVVANQAIAGEPRLAGVPARPGAPNNVIGSSKKTRMPAQRIQPKAVNTPTRVAALAGANGWTVKDVQITKVAPSLPKQRTKVLSPKDYLQGRILTIGKSVRMGKQPREKETAPGVRNGCVPNRNPGVMFCIEPIDWPQSIRKHFDVSTIMYIGPRAIIRYDDARATYLYSLFLSNSFDAVAKHLERLYGPPTESIKRVIAPLAQPRLSNPTMIWRSVDPTTSRITNLEIRRFDDARGGFPDTRHGVLLFHQAWTPAIFPMLSTLELMRVVK
jgi:hypothetical protein